MPLFPTAKRVVYYAVDGSPELHVKVSQSEGMRDPEAVRALLGDRIGFFVPVRPVPTKTQQQSG